jgi:hypothetical protein
MNERKAIDWEWEYAGNIVPGDIAQWRFHGHQIGWALVIGTCRETNSQRLMKLQFLTEFGLLEIGYSSMSVLKKLKL